MYSDTLDFEFCMKLFLAGFLYVFLVFVFLVPQVYAGFGITPPYVRNSSLIKNSTYEQKIILVRSDPTVPLNAEISVDVPGISEWFSVAEGSKFLLPAGEQKVTMTVRVKVPDNAEFKTYVGNIRVKTSAVDGQVADGAVSISLGAQIDVDITVIDKEILDFTIRKIGVSDLNEGHKFGWLYFPGKINFEMLLENIGNVKIAPSEVVFHIYDQSGQILLEETKSTNNIKKTAPFEQATVFAELPSRLPRGAYLVRYQIKNGADIKQEGEISLNILPYGTLNLAGYGFFGLSLAHKLSVLLPLFVILSTVIAILVRRSLLTSIKKTRTRS